MVVTNHTYDVIGSMFLTKEMIGSGLKYVLLVMFILQEKRKRWYRSDWKYCSL